MRPACGDKKTLKKISKIVIQESLPHKCVTPVSMLLDNQIFNRGLWQRYSMAMMPD